MTSILRHVAGHFLLVAGENPELPSIIDIVSNTSMVLNCALVTYLMMTADVGLPDAV